MNQFDLGSILDELHEKEFSEFCNVPMHHFSTRHRKAMKKLFNSGITLRYKPVGLKYRTARFIAEMISRA